MYPWKLFFAYYSLLYKGNLKGGWAIKIKDFTIRYFLYYIGQKSAVCKGSNIKIFFPYLIGQKYTVLGGSI